MIHRTTLTVVSMEGVCPEPGSRVRDQGDTSPAKNYMYINNIQ